MTIIRLKFRPGTYTGCLGQVYRWKFNYQRNTQRCQSDLLADKYAYYLFHVHPQYIYIANCLMFYPARICIIFLFYILHINVLYWLIVNISVLCTNKYQCHVNCNQSQNSHTLNKELFKPIKENTFIYTCNINICVNSYYYCQKHYKHTC